jgi:putative oxidoreductase
VNETGLISRWRSAAPYLLSILRIVCGLLFFVLGTATLFAFPHPVMPDGSTAALSSEGGVGGLLMVIGGALLILGLCTRAAAFILSGMMAVAYFQYHAPVNFWPMLNNGQPAIVFCFVYLYLSAAGGGPWSVDAMRGRG